MIQTDKYIKYGTQMVIRLESTDKFLCSLNFLKRPCLFKSQFSRGSFNSAIFIIQGQDSTTSQFTNQVSYSDNFYLKHKQTGRYLGLSKQSVQQPNDTTYKLQLKEEDQPRVAFRISECYLYQSKISKNVKVDQDSYLAAKLNANKQVFLRHDIELQDGIRAVCGYHVKEMLRFSHYGQGQPIMDAYRFSTYVAITHSETLSYLNMKEYPKLEFQLYQQDKDLNIQGIWVIQPQQYEKGGTVAYDQKIRFRNIYTASYLSFLMKPEQKLNQKIYPVELTKNRQQNTLFKLESMNNRDGPVKIGDYFMIQHATTHTYLQNVTNEQRIRSIEDDRVRYEPTSRSTKNSGDVFKFQAIAPAKIGSILLIITLQKQMKQLIQDVKQIKSNNINLWLKLQPSFLGIKQSFIKTLKHLQKIQSSQLQVFSYNQRILNRSIPCFVEVVQIIWAGRSIEDIKFQQISLSTVKYIFQILKKIAYKTSENKLLLYNYMGVWLNFLCLGVEVQQLIYQIFRSNRQLVFSIDNKIRPQNKTLIEYYINCLCAQPNKNIRPFYDNVQKFINICLVVTNLDGQPISYNQTFVTEILLLSGKFKELMFDFKVQNDRISLNMNNKWKDILEIKVTDAEFDLVVAQFNLLSTLCESRNLIAREVMAKNFICNAMINYIQMPKIAQILKSKIFKLITNIYIDSGPKTKRVIPYMILALSIDTTKQTQPSIEQQQINKQLIKHAQSQPSTFRVKYKKLDLENYLSTEKQNFSITIDDLELYRYILEQRIMVGMFSEQMFQSIQTLVVLQYLTHAEIKQFLKLLLEKMQDPQPRPSHQIVKQRVFILLELVSNLTDQINLNKSITMLKLLFYSSNFSQSQNVSISKLVEDNIQFILPNTNTLYYHSFMKNKQFVSNHPGLIEEYEKDNKFVEMAKQYATSLIQKFSQMKDINHRSRLFQLIWGWYFPNQHFLRLFSKTCLLTSNQEIELSNYLYKVYKKLSKLSECSEVWLRLHKIEDQRKLDKFCMYLAQAIDFFYDSHHAPDNQIVRQRRDTETAMNIKQRKFQLSKVLKYPNISLKRQEVIRRIGFHQLVFIFLKENFFYMQKLKKDQKNSPMGKTFGLCFEFLHGFIMCGNKNNKEELVLKLDLIFQYSRCVNIGQYALLAELYSMYPQLSVTLSQNQLKTIIDVIKGDGKKTGNYNAFLLQFLMNTVVSQSRVITSNLEKLLTFMSNTFVLKKLLYIEDVKDTNGVITSNFILNTMDILNQNIPFVYHFYLLRIINMILLHLRAGVDKIKKIMLETFSQNYLLSILAKPDHFTYKGTEAKLYFLLKIEVAKLIRNIHIYGEREPRRLVNSDALFNFLRSIERSLITYRERRYQNPKQQQSKILEEYAYYLKILQPQFEITYQKYLLTYYQPLVIHYKSLLQRFKDSETYKLSKQLCEKLQDLRITHKLSPSPTPKTNQQWRSDNNYIFKHVHFPMVPVFYSDDNEEDTHIQLFSKKMFIQICTNRKLRQIVKKEQETFFKDMINSKKYKPLVQSLCEFIIGLSQSFTDDSDSPSFSHQLIQTQNVIEFLSKFLLYNPTRKPQIIKIILSSKLIAAVFQLITSKFFKLDQPKAINMTVQFFNLINSCFIQNNSQIIDQLVEILESNNQFYKILAFMKDSILVLSVEKKCVQNINDILDNLEYSYITQQKCNPGLICLKLISNLSRNSQLYPFNQYLRRQKKSRVSIDFLPIIVNTVSFLLSSKESDKIMINLASFQTAITLIKTIKDLMYGPFEQNQNFLIQTKFPLIVLNLLKVNQCPQKMNQLLTDTQNAYIRIIHQKFSNINENLAHYFDSSYNKFSVSHDALLNLLKQSALDCIGEMILGNTSILSRLTIFIPEEYFKVNLIWVYDHFMKIEGRLKKTSLNNLIVDEQLMIESPQKHPILVTKNGFKLYQFIKLYEQFQNNDQSLKSEGQKEKDKKIEIIKKFFQLLKPGIDDGLIDQNYPYRKQMLMFKEHYSAAITFFESKTLNIQLSFQNSIYKVYFPKISLCEYFDKTYERGFKETASRVSQSSKLHAVMESALKVKDQLEVEENFSQVMANVHPKFYKWISFDNIMLLILISSAIINIVLISEIQQPVFQFPDTALWSFKQVKQILPGILAILGLLLFFLLLLLLIMKFIPKAIALAKGEIKRRIENQQEVTTKDKTFIYLDFIFSGQIIYCSILLCIEPLIMLNPILSVICLFDLLRLIETGRMILGAIADSWKQLFATTGIFLMFNYLYAFITYIAYSGAYAPVCQNLYHCFIFFNEFYFKAGQGLYGNIEKDYSNGNSITIEMILDLTYIIVGAFVIKQIFTGTIIDKFSEIREEKSVIQQDQASRCFICGMERYELEFELQGFAKHLKETHNVLHYIFFIFYLEKKPPETYNRLEKFVKKCLQRNNDSWFPSQNSLFKIKKSNQNLTFDHVKVDGKQQIKAQRKENRKKMLREIKTVANGLFQDLKNFHLSETKGLMSPTKR